MTKKPLLVLALCAGLTVAAYAVPGTSANAGKARVTARARIKFRAFMEAPGCGRSLHRLGMRTADRYHRFAPRGPGPRNSLNCQDPAPRHQIAFGLQGCSGSPKPSSVIAGAPALITARG